MTILAAACCCQEGMGCPTDCPPETGSIPWHVEIDYGTAVVSIDAVFQFACQSLGGTGNYGCQMTSNNITWSFDPAQPQFDCEGEGVAVGFTVQCVFNSKLQIPEWFVGIGVQISCVHQQGGFFSPGVSAVYKKNTPTPGDPCNYHGIYNLQSFLVLGFSPPFPPSTVPPTISV